MKILRSTVVSACLALASFAPGVGEAAVPASKFLHAAEPIQGRYIVVLDPA